MDIQEMWEDDQLQCLCNKLQDDKLLHSNRRKLLGHSSPLLAPEMLIQATRRIEGKEKIYKVNSVLSSLIKVTASS